MSDTNPVESQNTAPLDVTPNVASSVVGIRRVFAALVDGLILGSIGFALTWSMSDELAAIGPSTRWIGLPILIAYFGLLNSKISGGQTIGKRLLRVKVVGYDGKPISVGKSILRAALLETPIIMNGAVYTFSTAEYLYSIVAVYAVFLVWMANMYLFLLNRTTRQGLHDIAAGTFVIRADDSVEVLPSASQRRSAIRGNLVIVSIHAVLLTGGLFWFWNWVSNTDKRGLYDDLLTLQRDLISLEAVSYAGISVNIEHPSPAENSYLSVTLYMTAPTDTLRPLATELICTLADNHRWMKDKERIAITGIYGYDIGIWSFWRSASEQFDPSKFACEDEGELTQTSSSVESVT